MESAPAPAAAPAASAAKRPSTSISASVDLGGVAPDAWLSEAQWFSQAHLSPQVGPPDLPTLRHDLYTISTHTQHYVVSASHKLKEVGDEHGAQAQHLRQFRNDLQELSNRVSKDFATIYDRIRKVERESMAQNSKLFDMLPDAKILEGRLENAKLIIEHTIADADAAHAKLRSTVSAGLQDQGELRQVVGHILDSHAFVDRQSHLILDNRIATVENIMAAASQVNDDRMSAMEKHVQVMCESMSEAIARGQCRCPMTCPGEEDGQVGSPGTCDRSLKGPDRHPGTCERPLGGLDASSKESSERQPAASAIPATSCYASYVKHAHRKSGTSWKSWKAKWRL